MAGTLLDLNLNEDDPRYQAVEKVLDEEKCYIAPVTLAEICRRIRDDISTQRADLLYESALNGGFLDLFHADSNPRFIQLLIKARDMGIPYVLAFPAAMASFLDADLMTNEVVFDALEREGFCKIRRY